MSTNLSKKQSIDDIDKIVADLTSNFKWIVTEITESTTQIYTYPVTQFMKAYIRWNLRCIRVRTSAIATRTSLILHCDGDMLRTVKLFTYENRSAQLQK